MSFSVTKSLSFPQKTLNYVYNSTISNEIDSGKIITIGGNLLILITLCFRIFALRWNTSR